jgi:hypothetical protein
MIVSNNLMSVNLDLYVCTYDDDDDVMVIMIFKIFDTPLLITSNFDLLFSN